MNTDIKLTPIGRCLPQDSLNQILNAWSVLNLRQIETFLTGFFRSQISIDLGQFLNIYEKDN